MIRHVVSLSIASVLAGVVALTPHGFGAHAQTLTPPPPPGAVCQSTGDGTLCRGVLTDSGVNVDAGISCGTFDVLGTYSEHTTYEMWYNADGLATKFLFHHQIPETLVNSVTGKSITANTYDTSITTFGVPGDRTTRTLTINGALNISTGAHFGLVSHDVGGVTFDSIGDVLFEAGPHNLVDNFPGFVDAVCSALA